MEQDTNLKPRQNNPLLFKYFLLSVVVFLVSVILGVQTSKIVMRSIKLEMSKQELAKACQIIQQIQQDQQLDDVQAFQKFMQVNPEYLDPSGVLFKTTGERVFALDAKAPAVAPEESKNLPAESCTPVLMKSEYRQAMMRLSPNVFLKVSFMPSRLESIAHSEAKSSDYRIFRKHPVIHGLVPEEITALILVAFLLGGFALSMATAVFFYRRAAKVAGRTLEDLKNGNLQSRFLINGRQPSGIGAKFNEMADEIEKLVEHLRDVENGRTKILQELAHDLKTPVASLRGLLESMRDQGEQMSLEQKNDFLNTAISETWYFSRLVEDLLFISGVTHPHYKRETRKVDLVKLIRDEIRIYEKQEDFAISLRAPEKAEILGEEILLKRLFRNALDNALSFATSSVIIDLRQTSDEIQLWVVDDGPGIHEADIPLFGVKRMTRRSDESNQGRISLGLGSVIMKKIANIYGGDVTIHRGTNLPGQSAEEHSGTTLKIDLKL